MLQNTYFLAKIGADTAENEQHFAEICQKLAITLESSRTRRASGPDLPHLLGPKARTKFRQNVARFRLYRHRFLQGNTRFSAFFIIYQIIKLNFLKFGKILQILRHLQNFAEVSHKLQIFQAGFLLKF